MADYTGKVAFITGGASGAGFGQATVFAQAGCRIVIADVRRAAIEEAAASLRGQGAQVHAIELDVTDRAAFARAADEVERDGVVRFVGAERLEGAGQDDAAEVPEHRSDHRRRLYDGCAAARQSRRRRLPRAPART